MALSGEDDLDLKDHKIAENRTQFILKREEWLKEEQAAVAERIKDQQSRSLRLEKKIKDNEARLARLQEEQQVPQVSLERKKMQTQKVSVLDMIGEMEKTLETVRVQKMFLDRELAEMEKEQDKTNAQVVHLREKAGPLRLETRQSERQDRKLKEQADKIEREKTRTIKMAQLDVQTARADRDLIKKNLRELRDSVAGIAAQAKKDQDALKRISASLKEESFVLAQRKGVLAEAVAVHEDFLQMAKALPEKNSPIDPFEAALKEKGEDQGGLLQGIKEQTARKMDMLQEKAELKNELRRLEARKIAVRRQSRTGGERALRTKENAVRTDVSQWRRTVERRKNEVARIEAESANLESRMAAFEAKEQGLKEQRTAVEESSQAMNEEKLRLEGGTRAAAQEKGKSARQLEREIKDLQMRNTLLSGSLAVIQSRFNAKDLEVRAFRGDEVQLREYLRVLREENLGLTDKLTVLSVAVEKLTAQKKILGASQNPFKGVVPSVPGAEVEPVTGGHLAP